MVERHRGLQEGERKTLESKVYMVVKEIDCDSLPERIITECTENECGWTGQTCHIIRKQNGKIGLLTPTNEPLQRAKVEYGVQAISRPVSSQLTRECLRTRTPNDCGGSLDMLSLAELATMFR
jgi:hypothetical protein